MSSFTFFQRGVGKQLFDCLKSFTLHWIMKVRWDGYCFYWETQSSVILSCWHACLLVLGLDVWGEMSTIFWTCSWRLSFVVMNCGACLQVSAKVVVNASSHSSCITKETESNGLTDAWNMSEDRAGVYCSSLGFTCVIYTGISLGPFGNHWWDEGVEVRQDK